MLRSRKVRRGQTAVEMMLVTMIVLTGIIVAAPLYVDNSFDSTLLYAVRNAASQASAYVSTGVVVNDSKYSPLNELIRDYTGYRSVILKFVGVKMLSKNDTDASVLVRFEYALPLDSTSESVFEAKLGEFMALYLNGTSEFRLSDGNLYYKGKRVDLSVEVVSP